jgi:hypothetical protein
MTSFINVETDPALLLVRGPAAASDNSEKLNAALRSSSHKAPFFFPGGDWYFAEDTTTLNINGTCIETVATSGWSFIGAGGWRVVNDGSVFTGPMAAQIIYAGPRISLASVTHSVTGASATIRITSGYTVKTQDVGATVHITGGTNAEIDDATHGSWYVIESVNTVNNEWTLDRPCTSGSSSNLTGLMTYSLWKDRGFGNFYEGLHFKGNEDAGVATTSRCHLGMHVVADTSQSALTGKHVYFNCSWSDFNVHNLAGKDLRKAYAQTASGSLSGEANQNCHADHLTYLCSIAEHGKNFLYLRNRQSVSHVIRDQIHCININESFVYAERGGELLIDSMVVGGSRGPVLRVGVVTSGNGNFIIRKLSHDANGASIPKLYLKDQGNGSGTTTSWVTFDTVHIDATAGDLQNWADNDVIVDSYSGDRIVLRNVNPLRAGCIKMTKGNGTNPRYEPLVSLENCMMFSSLSSPADVKNSSSSSPFGTLVWRGCSTLGSATNCYPDGRIPAFIPVGGTALTITNAQHADRIVKLDHTGAASTCTLPNATGSGARFLFVVAAVNTSSHIIKVPNANNTFAGSVNILDSDGTAQAAYAARAADGDDTLTLNGTTTGGQIGDWVEFIDFAANTWVVRGQLVVPLGFGYSVVDPFSATV